MAHNNFFVWIVFISRRASRDYQPIPPSPSLLIMLPFLPPNSCFPHSAATILHWHRLEAFHSGSFLTSKLKNVTTCCLVICSTSRIIVIYAARFIFDISVSGILRMSLAQINVTSVCGGETCFCSPLASLMNDQGDIEMVRIMCIVEIK